MPEAGSLRLITFRVGPETFVLDIMAVRQIVPYAGSTSVPTAPAFIEGIVVLRNEASRSSTAAAHLPRAWRRCAGAARADHPHERRRDRVKGDEGRRIVTCPQERCFRRAPHLVRGIRGELLIAVVPFGEEVYL